MSAESSPDSTQNAKSIQKGTNAMYFSPPSLHAPILRLDAHKEEVGRKLEEISARHREATKRPPTDSVPDSIAIPLTTVSLAGNFDAWIHITFRTSRNLLSESLVVDSGNSMLIVPHGENLVGLPDYVILGTGTEPWGCPCNVVKGPIDIPTADGGIYTLEDCIFYACIGDNKGGLRTANFGTGRPTPWSANGWNKVAGVTMQAPLSYNTAYPYAEFSYAPATSMFSDSNAPTIDTGSSLIVYASEPAGYTMLDTIRNLEWMSLVPAALTIGSTLTQWPGTVSSPIAMVDTGGGPTFLSDPNGYLYKSQWPHPVTCPSWTSSSEDCTCSSDNFTLTLNSSEKSMAYTYTVDTAGLPTSVQGLTLVMCKYNSFMMNQQGMNIGGISALFNDILIDYSGSRVGLKPKT